MNLRTYEIYRKDQQTPEGLLNEVVVLGYTVAESADRAIAVTCESGLHLASDLVAVEIET